MNGPLMGLLSDERVVGNDLDEMTSVVDESRELL